MALMLKVLLDAGQESPCFNTAIGRAILSEASRRTARGHFVDSLVDVAYILILVRMAVALDDREIPEVSILTLFAVLSMFIAGSLMLKLFGGMYLFASSAPGFMVGVMKHVNLWNVLLTATEAFSTFVGWRFLIYARSGNVSDAWELFKSHPAFLSVLVLVRWSQVAVSLLQVEGIGRNIVPVFYAVTRPASINFLIFLAIVVCGSFHAYFVFPIKENFGSFNHMLNAFMKIFRLEVLGDFDLTEMEGLGEVMKGNISKGLLRGEVDEESESNIHRSLRLEFLVLSLVVTVVAMNVYIGLLGELYSTAIKKQHRLYNHFLASTAYRFISRQVGMRVLFGGCCAHSPRDDGDGLMWFSYDKDYLIDVHADHVHDD